ncbi:MAG: hypothetical protein AAGF11_27800 [Myxococcota bacterium]
MPIDTQGPEAPGKPEQYAQSFPLQTMDLFTGEGCRGEEIELDEDALAAKADMDAKAAKKDKASTKATATKTSTKKSFRTKSFRTKSFRFR